MLVNTTIPVYKCRLSDFPGLIQENTGGAINITQLIENSYCINFTGAYIKGNYDFKGIGVQLTMQSSCPNDTKCNDSFLKATEHRLLNFYSLDYYMKLDDFFNPQKAQLNLFSKVPADFSQNFLLETISLQLNNVELTDDFFQNVFNRQPSS